MKPALAIACLIVFGLALTLIALAIKAWRGE